MANGQNPFAIFQTPEFAQMDLFERWMNFQQAAATMPEFNALTPKEREYVRQNVVGYKDRTQFYPQVKARMQELDAESQQRIFSALMQDDPDWHELPASERQATRRELVPPMDVGKEHTLGGFGVKYQPPEGYQIPHRPLTVPGPQEQMTAELAAEEEERAARRQVTPWLKVKPLEQAEEPFNIMDFIGEGPAEEKAASLETLVQPFIEMANNPEFPSLSQQRRSAIFNDIAANNDEYMRLPLEAKTKIREAFVNDPRFNPQVSDAVSPEGFFEGVVGIGQRGEARASAATSQDRYEKMQMAIQGALEKHAEGKADDAYMRQWMPKFQEGLERYAEKYGAANAALAELGVSDATRKINLINVEAMEKFKDKPPEKGLIRGTADFLDRTKALMNEIGKQDAWGDFFQFVAETTGESFVSYGLTAIPATMAATTMLSGTPLAPVAPVLGPMAGTGYGSYLLEFSAAFGESLQEAGVDITDKDALIEAALTPEIMAKAKAFGKARGVPIAAFDAASAGIAGSVGKILGAPGKVLSRVQKVGAGAGLLGQAAILGGAGEYAAQKISGQQLDPLAVAIEALAEVAQAPVETSMAAAASRYGPINARAEMLRLGISRLSEEERIALAATRPLEGKYGEVVTAWDIDSGNLRIGVMGKNGQLISPVKMTLTPEQADAFEARRKANEIAGILPSVSQVTVMEKLARFEERMRKGDMSRQVGAAHLANVIESLEKEDAEKVLTRAQEIANDRLRQRGMPAEMFEQGETRGMRQTDVTPDEMEMINFGAVRDALYEHLGRPPVEEGVVAAPVAAPAAVPEDLAARTEAFEERMAERERPRDQIDEIQDELRTQGQKEAADVFVKYRTGDPLTAEEFAIIEEAQAAVDPDVAGAMQTIRDATLAPIDEVQRKADVATVLEAVLNGRETVKEITDETGFEPDRVRIYANELAEKGRVDARSFQGVDKPARFTPPGQPTAGEAQQAAPLPKPTRVRGSKLQVGDLIESPDLGPARITKIDQRGQGIRVVHYQDATGTRETMTVRPTTYTDVYEVAQVPAQFPEADVREQLPAIPEEAAETAAALEKEGEAVVPPAKPEPAQAPPPESPQRQRLDRMADRYRKLVNAATTEAELRAVEEQWGRERSKPWWAGIEEEFTKKRGVLAEEAAVTAALTPKPREVAPIAEAPEAPETAAEAKPVVTPEEAARRPYRGLYGADGRPLGGQPAIEVPGVVIPEPVPIDRLASQNDVLDALKAMAGVKEDPALDEFAEDQPVEAAEKEAPRGKEKVQEEGEVAEEAPAEEAPAEEEIVLPEIEEKMLGAIKDGRDTISKIQEAIAYSRRQLIKAMKSLNKKGLVNVTEEPTEEGKSPRYVMSLPEEGQKAEPLRRQTREEKKTTQKEARKEASKEKVQKLVEDLESPVTPEQELADAKKRESEAGVLRLEQPERKKNNQRTEATKDITGWEYKTVRDFLMRGRTGMTSEMKKAWDAAAGTMDGYRREAQADFLAITRAIDRIAGTFRWAGKKRNTINRLVNAFLRGEEGVKTPAELAAILKLDPESKNIKAISDARDRTRARHQEILDSPHIPDVVKEAMKDQDFYLRLAYTRYLTDKRLFGKWRKFQPDETARQEALGVLSAAFEKEVDKVIEKYEDLRAELPKDFDFTGFLEEAMFDKGALENLPPAMRDRLRAFRTTFRNWKQAIQFQTALDGESIYAVRMADALRSYAEVAIEQLLRKGGIAGLLETPGSQIDVNNLERRVLSDVFRRLYGEVDDPAVLQALSVEAQGTLLSQFMFFEEMLHHGQDIVWSEEKLGNPQLSAKLGDENNQKDVFKYGSLAGMYVDPLFKQFLDRKGSVMIGLNNIIDLATLDEKVIGAYAGKAFQRLQGTTRMMALMSFGAWWRNYLSSYLTFALQAGDVMHGNFNKKFFKYTAQAVKVAFGDEKATRELAEDMKKGAFGFASASIVSDFQPATKDHASRLDAIAAMKSIPRKIKESYILIDYAAKKAAFESRVEIAKRRVPDISQEDAEQFAREHVEKFYQNANRVPAFVATIGRVGMGDFLGFQYDSGRMAINSAVNMILGLTRAASRPGDRLYRWKGILNKYPELQDTWEGLVGFIAARGVGLGIWGPGQYLLAMGPANAVMSVTFGQLLQSLRLVDEDDEIEETTAAMERALNELMPSYDGMAQKYTYKLTNPTTGEVRFQVVPLSNQFGNAFEDQAIGIAQRMGVAEESPNDIASSMLRPENILNHMPIGMAYQNLIRLWTGYDPQTQMKRANMIEALRLSQSGRFGDAGDQAKDAMIGYLADTSGSVGRMWKRYMVYQEREGRTPVPGSRKRALETEAFDQALDIAMPMIRPLRVVTYDEEEIKRVLPYKLGPVATKVAGMRAGMREPVKAARDYLEGASEEELATGLASKRGYIIALKEMEERVEIMRPVFEAVGLSNETIVQQLMDGLPAEAKLRRPEAEAVVNGTVDQFEFSEDFYEPESKPTGSMKGDDIIEMQLRANPYVSWTYLYNVLSAQGYQVGTIEEFRGHFRRIKTRIYK